MIPSAKKEAKRLEALAKKAAKVPKTVVEVGSTSTPKTSAPKKAEKNEETPFVNSTLPGYKKGAV
jgi:hypothetical protein